MIVFILITATMNIALGYGLAVYLGHARRMRRGGASGFGDEEAAAQEDHEQPADVASEAPASMPAAAIPVAPTSPPVPASSFAPISVAAGVQAEAEESTLSEEDAAQLESDVLAGIEEFRNQLAQMKAQNAEAEAASPTAPVKAGV